MASYTYPLPVLKDYDVSAKTGFLPEEMPLESLPEYYQSWEKVAKVIPALLLTKRVRSVVDTSIPLLTCDNLVQENQWRRAYTILGFIAHAYIWGVNEPNNKLPAQIAQPWIEVSKHLRLPPIATYAGLCLWNYRFIFPQMGDVNNDTDFLDNIQTINTFTGSTDESWFYLVSVYFEYKGAPCITNGLNAIRYARENNIDKVIENLKLIAESIDHLGSVLMKMEEMCDPHVFYFRLRPYLAGWKNMKEVGLDDGVYYGEEKQPRIYAGGSNAQSSLIQTLDLILNVEHQSTGQKSSSGGENPFMAEMRSYMPGKHSDFLTHLSKINIIRHFVTKNSHEHPELLLAYDASVAMLKAFRDKHIQIVTRYIILQAQKARQGGSESLGSGTLRAGLAKSNKKELTGTGGTALLPFLKQCRDETGNTAAGSWGQRLLSDKANMKSNNLRGQAENVNNENVIGLAGQWRDDKSNVKQGHW